MGQQRNPGVTVNLEASCSHLLDVPCFPITTEVGRSVHACDGLTYTHSQGVGSEVRKAAQPENLRYNCGISHCFLFLISGEVCNF